MLTEELAKHFTTYRKFLLYYPNNFANYISNNLPISILDPCMGTGGWVVSIMNLIKSNNKQFINFQLSGNDVKLSTYKYGLMNLFMNLFFCT